MCQKNYAKCVNSAKCVKSTLNVSKVGPLNVVVADGEDAGSNNLDDEWE